MTSDSFLFYLSDIQKYWGLAGMGTGAEGVHRREESKVFQGTKDVLSPLGAGRE